MKTSILDRFASDAIDAPVAVTGGGGKRKCKRNSKSSKKTKSKSYSKSKSRTKSKSYSKVLY